MTVDQAVQYSYMAPNDFKALNTLDLKTLFNEVKVALNKLSQKCPQSPDKDCIIYQYQYTLNVIKKFIN